MALAIREQVPLKDKTTFRVGGAARFFVSVTTAGELKEALAFARASATPFFILGGGSNVLIADEGFPGLVIKLALEGIFFEERRDGSVLVTASAGEVWDDLVARCVARGLYGVENMSGIPGSVGATPIQNVGAYGAEVRDVVESVGAIDVETGAPRVFSNEACSFSYRTSFFKTSGGKRYVVTSVSYRLSPDGKLNTSYRDVEEYFASLGEEPTLPRVRQAVLEIRARKFPDLSKHGTAGSFFKNPIITKEHYDELKERYPHTPSYSVDFGRVKIPAGWLIEHVGGFRGVARGDVRSHPAQALVLVNTGNATAHEIVSFANEIEKVILQRTKIKFEREVQYVS